jgi:hypothetical protein
MTIQTVLTRILGIVLIFSFLFIAGCDKLTSTDTKKDTPVTSSLVATPSSISVLVNGYGTIAISGGKVPYTATSSDSAKIIASINGTSLTILGRALGSAIVTVKDSSGSAAVSIPVTVAEIISSPSTVNVLVGATASAVISGGTTPYSIKTSPEGTKATASISGSTLSVTGVATGTTSVEVKDASTTAKTVVVPINVTGPLAVDKSSVSVASGSSTTVAISGGTSPYQIKVNPDAAVATGAISGSTLTITGVAAGTASVTIGDNAGATKTVSITVTGGTPSSGIDPLSVGAWFNAADISGMEIQSDGKIMMLTVNTSGKLVYSGDSIYQKVKLTRVTNGTLAGTVTTYNSNGTVDTSFSFTGTYILSNSNNTMILTVTGPFDGPIATMTMTLTKSSLNATVTGGFLSLSNYYLQLTSGATGTVTISQGTAPYSITYNNNPGVATATISSGSTITVTAAAVGYTSFTVKDNSSPLAKYARLDVNVSPQATTMYLSPSSLNLTVGGYGTSTIYGGTSPYSMYSNSNSSVASATLLSGGGYMYLSVNALSSGSTTITIRDNSPTMQFTTLTVTVSGSSSGLTATPSSAAVAVGYSTQVTVSGGTSPYSIQTSPNIYIATATISSSTVTITGVASGTTQVVVKDNSSPAKTVTIPITVTSGGGFTTSGSLSFSMLLNGVTTNWSASGIYNNSGTSGSGAGGLLYTGTTDQDVDVIAYKFNSSTSVDVAVLNLTALGTISTGDYLVVNSTGKSAYFIYMPNLKPYDTSSTFQDGYMLYSGKATVNSYSTTAIQGSFNGSAYYLTNLGPDMTKLPTISNGAFNVPVITGYTNDAKGLAKTQLDALIRTVKRIKQQAGY